MRWRIIRGYHPVNQVFCVVAGSIRWLARPPNLAVCRGARVRRWHKADEDDPAWVASASVASAAQEKHTADSEQIDTDQRTFSIAGSASQVSAMGSGATVSPRAGMPKNDYPPYVAPWRRRSKRRTVPLGRPAKTLVRARSLETEPRLGFLKRGAALPMRA